MHAEALGWVQRYGTNEAMVALEIGGRNINGTGRGFFPNADWTVLDLTPGAGVTVVADAATWEPDREYDLVLCTEVFEHTEVWREIVQTAHSALRPGGRLIVTAACPPRAPHSAVDGAELRSGEHYANLDPDDLRECLSGAGFTDVVVDVLSAAGDVRAVGFRPETKVRGRGSDGTR